MQSHQNNDVQLHRSHCVLNNKNRNKTYARQPKTAANQRRLEAEVGGEMKSSLSMSPEVVGELSSTVDAVAASCTIVADTACSSSSKSLLSLLSASIPSE